MDEYIEYKDNQKINSSPNEPVYNDEKNDEPLLDEDSEEPCNPQAKYP